MVMLGWFAPDPTPVLEGPHVVLRGPRPRDYEAWRALRRTHAWEDDENGTDGSA